MKKKLFREQYQEPIGRIEPEIIGEETFEPIEIKPKKTTKKRKATK